MKLNDAVVLLPVESLEDLSLDLRPTAAESILSAWTVPFHPAILASVGKAIRWECAEHFTDTDDLAETLVLLPGPSAEALPDDWIDEAEAAGALVARDFADRDATVRDIVQQLDPSPDQLPFDQIDANLAADLMALGFCHLQVELLTRQQYYMGSLDSESFDDRALRAAEAIARGDRQTAEEELQSAFDLLTEGREYFFSLQPRLLDLTLIATSTMGKSLADELAGEIPKGLLLSGRTLAAMADEQPKTLDALRAALGERRVDLVGGEYGEPALALATPEAIWAGIRRGLACYDTHLRTRPSVFGRRRFGLSPLLPQILKSCGFSAACHFTLDAGQFPSGNQSRISWGAEGGATIPALAGVPLDASSVESFLQLPERMSGDMDVDDVPTVAFAHWPGAVSHWYDALRRMHRYGPTLGQFAGLDAYFEETADSGQPAQYGPDEYRAPYLTQSIEKNESDPISRWVRYFRRQATLDAIVALDCMARVVCDDAAPLAELDALRDEIEDMAECVSGESQPDEGELDGRLDAGLRGATQRLGDALAPNDVQQPLGRLHLNPWSSVRAVQQMDEGTQAGVEAPGMGFAWVGPDESDEAGNRSKATVSKPFWRRKARREAPRMADEHVLRNEFFEAAVDPTTGSLRAVHDYHTRGNRIAAQLALRSRELAAALGDAAATAGEEAPYSVMAAERIETENIGQDLGRITTRGRLVDRHGNRLAGFCLVLEARRGSRVLEMDVELTPEREPGANPWQSYYAARFAWGDSAADVYRSVNSTSWPTEAMRFEAPHFVELRSENRRTAILTGGLPYHRRLGLRKMDSLLVVRGETARRFRLGIGIDLPHAAGAAVDFLGPRSVYVDSTPPSRARSGWLFHVDTPNVTATAWEPLVGDGQVVGFRVRLLETEGAATRSRLRAFRVPATAERTNLLGHVERELKIVEDYVDVDLAAHEWVQVDVRWK